METESATIILKGTDVAIPPSTCLACYISECWRSQCFFPPISEVSDRRHSASEKSYTDLLLANCGILFHSYMSAQAVIVSVIITTIQWLPSGFITFAVLSSQLQEAEPAALEQQPSASGFQGIIAAWAQTSPSSLHKTPIWTCFLR